MRKLLLITNRLVQYRFDLFVSLLENNNSIIKYVFIEDKASKHKEILNVNNSLINKNSIFLNNGLNSIIRLFFYLNKYKPNLIINGNLGMANLPLIFYTSFINRKSLLYLWWGGTILSESKIEFLKTISRKLFYSFYKGALCYSELSKDYLITLSKKKKHYIVLGNNTYDIDKFNKKIKYIKIPEKKFDIISIGFQDKRKNTILLLNALKALQSKGISISCLIVGDGPELEKLKQKAKIDNLKKIIFIGEIKPDKVLSYLIKSKILVHPSLLDQWPQVFNEAAMTKTPVIISNTSGVCNNYIKKFKEQVTFSPNDEQELAYLIEHLLSNTNLQNELSTSIYKEAVQNNKDSVYSKIESLLRNF